MRMRMRNGLDAESEEEPQAPHDGGTIVLGRRKYRHPKGPSVNMKIKNTIAN